MKTLSKKALANIDSNNPKHNPCVRRVRPTYPALEPGEQQVLRRDECGAQRPFTYLAPDPETGLPIVRHAKRLVRAFVMLRERHVDRSKYLPGFDNPDRKRRGILAAAAA